MGRGEGKLGWIGWGGAPRRLPAGFFTPGYQFPTFVKSEQKPRKVAINRMKSTTFPQPPINEIE